MKKVLLTATVQSHICQFHRPLINMLHEHGYEVHVAARNNLEEKNGLKLDFVDKVYNVPFARSPKSLDNLKAYRKLKKIIDGEQYEVIHCNTPMGGIITRLASRKSRRSGTKVYYTAHGFHFYKGAPKKNWLCFYPIEKEMSRLTDIVITITKEDYQLAKKNFYSNVEHIYGVGVDEDKYLSITEKENEKFKLDNEYNGKFVILCTGELNANKNQKTVINAMKIIVNEYPSVLLLLAGNGPNEKELRKQIEKLELTDYIELIGYRTDLEKFTNACDMVVSASFREGMPLNIMEAMICGKPVVASYNRGHRELVLEDETGYLVPADDASSFAKYIIKLIKNEKLRSQFGIAAKKRIVRYQMKYVKKKLEKIYNL
ncbi:MAG: glycosyltransferase family 4 protein [Lachnospiraceae bacterium]|nr:glycosyltransferase family 4 protein [Lachnospiraceae bacterium]